MPPATKKNSLTAWKQSVNRSGFERETWENNDRLLKEAEIFGWLRFHETLPGALQADRHPGVYEIHYLKRGHLNWWVENDSYGFRPGSVFIVRPNELHGGDEESLQPCEHFWLRVRLDGTKDALPALTPAEMTTLRKGFEGIRHTTFPVSTMVGEYFDHLLAEHRTRDATSILIARGLLHGLLGTILRDYSAFLSHSQGQPLITWRVRKALEILNSSETTESPKVAELAGKVGLSESGFRERFKMETGFSPHEYILNQRITEARRRLTETGDDITHIALDLGFASSQYFATVFRRRVGMSPGDYRKRHKVG